MDLVAYLESKGCIVKHGGANNIYTHCWVHEEETSKRGRLYINADEQSEMYGAYWCHVCSAKGGLNAIRKHFGDAPLDFDSTSSSPIMRCAVDYYSDRLFENVEAYTYLVEERGLTHENIKKMRLGWADGGLLTHLLASGFNLEEVQEQGLINHFGNDFLRDRIVIPYMEYGEPYTIRGKKIGEKYLSLPGSTAHLYGVDNIRGESTVHIAAGEFDCAILNQLGFPAVGVPGEKMWKPEWTEALVDAQRIFIILDPDETGKAGAEKLATILGPRCRVVELPIPEGHKSTDVSKMYVKGGATREDFEFLISRAKGGLLVSPAQAFDEWLEWEGNPDMQGLRFGLEPIDNEMTHGLLPGQVVTLLARTNCLVGDTDLIVNRAGKSFHITLEELVRKFNGGKPRGGRSWDQSIPTKVQRRADDGTVRLVEIQDAWCSGVKEVYRLWTVCGRDIKATAQHPFLTENGYVQLGDLSPGDEVYVNVGKGQAGRSNRHYKAKSGLHYHPYRTKRTVYPGNTAEKSTVQLHRLVAEAQLNCMSLEDFLHRCRRGPVDDLRFINPATHVVHHMDGDYTNNDPNNLSVLTHEIHNVVHGYHAGNVLDRTELTEIAGIEYLGEEVTYDIEVVDDPHNFIANEFVVHNTGKTIFSLNILHRMRMIKPDIKILFLSLEQMRNEWFERAHRIHNFYQPGATTLDTVNYWKDNIFLVDENRISEETLEMLIEQYKFETGCKPDIVLVDYLGYYARSFQGEEYARITAAIMGLKGIAKRHKLVFLAPHQANRSNDMGSEVRMDQGRGAGTVEETSDVSLTMWNPDQRKPEHDALLTKADQLKELILKMPKARDSGVNTMCVLQSAPLTLAIVPKGDPLYERALRERQYWIQGMDWKDAVMMHMKSDDRVELDANNQWRPAGVS